MKHIVLFGPPGCGKGTQSIKLIKKYNMRHVSTGDLLRKEIKDKSSLGLKAKEFMDHGNLVPNTLITEFIQSFINNESNFKSRIIFDGFPRTIQQAKSLDQILVESASLVQRAIFINVDTAELTRRLQRRGESSGRADDQNIDIINNRFKEYNQNTFPLREFYFNQNKFSSVNGDGSIDQTFDAICKIIETE